jgi:hypothetical protein
MTTGPERQRGKLAPRMRVTICVVAMVIGASGCTAVRTNLGTSDSSCYLALPAATKGVHSAGKLVGVQRSTLTKMEKSFPHFVDDLHLGGVTAQSVCLFAYSGQFTAQSVSKPGGRPDGRLAVVVLSTPSNFLLGTVILKHAPLRFGHPHIG